MRMKRLLAFVLVASAPLGLLGGCTSDALVPSGGACFQTIDCQLGLVCIYVNDAGSCTNNLQGIATLPEGGDAAQQDVTPMDSPADQIAPADNNVPDNNVQDTSTQDTGTPTDAGTG